MGSVPNEQAYAWGCGGSNLSETITSSENSYYANRTDLKLDYLAVSNMFDSYTTTGQKLEISDQAFANANTAIGTDALDLLKGQQEKIRQLATDYKLHVVDGISPLLFRGINNINNTSNNLAGSIDVQQYFQLDATKTTP